MQTDSKKATLELIFISISGLVVLAAFVAALGYDFVSARAPLCIMVPLLLLIAFQVRRTRRAARATSVIGDIGDVIRGKNAEFNSVFKLMAWMALLVGVIFVGGHYTGMVLFLFLLLHVVGKESLVLSIAVTIGVTLGIYLLFEHLFNIELYRGVIFNRVFAYGV